MHCPKCRTVHLMPTKLEEGLPAMGCPKCEGSLLSLLYYRYWAERVDPESLVESGEKELVSDADTKTALCCPKCARLMTKYLVSGSLDARIDLCGNCDEAWLDGGEWSLLKSLEQANRLPRIFTDHWQNKVRSEKVELNRVERLRKAVGGSDSEKAIEVRAWLRGNPNRATILRFLGTE